MSKGGLASFMPVVLIVSKKFGRDLHGEELRRETESDG